MKKIGILLAAEIIALFLLSAVIAPQPSVGAKIGFDQRLERTITNICFRGVDNTKGTERRFGILVALCTHKNLTFNEISKLTSYSPGAISQDMTLLENLGSITIDRHFSSRGKRQTSYGITKSGKENLKKDLDSLSACIDLLTKTKECG